MADPLDDVTQHIKRTLIDTLWTSLPAEIMSVANYTEKQQIDVKPVLAIKNPSGSLLEPAVLYNVPVQLYSGGGALFSLPLAVGDIVELKFQMSDIEKWKIGNGKLTVPDTERKHNINDAIAIPCLSTSLTTLQPDATDLVIKFSGSEIRLRADGDVLVESLGNVVIKAPKVELDSPIVNLGASATEAVLLGTTFLPLFNSHTHSAAGLGTPNTPLPPTILSNRVKALV